MEGAQGIYRKAGALRIKSQPIISRCATQDSHPVSQFMSVNSGVLIRLSLQYRNLTKVSTRIMRSAHENKFHNVYREYDRTKGSQELEASVDQKDES